MKILALDPGTNCGWAYRDEDGHIESGVQRFDMARSESPGMRFMRFNEWLRELTRLRFHAGDLIIFEQPPYLRSGYAVDLLIGMTTRMIERAARCGCEHKGVNANTLKKAVAGRGNADKPDMARAVAMHFPQLNRTREYDDNEVDALALLVWHDLGMPEPGAKPRKRKRAKPEVVEV
jgi:Holliday junction resolvasome RuvABC endonuclease subunit